MAINKKWWGNVNEAKKGPKQNSENNENCENNEIMKFCKAINEKWQGNVNFVVCARP